MLKSGLCSQSSASPISSMYLWRGLRTRGPADGPSSSACSPPGTSSRSRGRSRHSSSSRTALGARGAPCMGPTTTLGSSGSSPSHRTHPAPPAAGTTRAFRSSRNSPATAAGGSGRSMSSGAALALSRSSGASGPSEGTRRSWSESVSYEEDDEPVRLVPAPTGKTLGINMDLMIWRSRTGRIDAAMSLDKEQRRQLLKQSEETLRRCLSLDPSDPRPYVVLGKLLLQQKRYDEARKLYAEGTAATANNSPYIWSSWGWLEYKTGNLAAARKLYDAAVVVDQTHACAWHKWGMLERSEGNFLRARDLWMQGIQKCRRKPQNQTAYLYNALAVMASQVGRVEEARAWFEEGTRTLAGAASVALWQAWAVLEARAGDPTAVRYLFKRALGVNPRSRYVHLAWAMWERKQGNPELCVQLLQRGQSLNPTDPAIYQAWAILEKERGDYERAASLFEAGLKADPNHIYLWQAWGCMEAERGNTDRARELFQQGVWADPNSRNTLYIFHAWGVLEKRLNNVGLARELFKAAIKVDPKSESVWSTWVAMEEELGFLDRADDLRMRQAEQQWEFEIPYNFTTRPAESPLSGLVETLSRFFTAREQGQGKPASGSGKRTLRDLLPDDFDANLSAQDIIPSLLPVPSARQPDFEQSMLEQQLAGRQAGLQAGRQAGALGQQRPQGRPPPPPPPPPSPGAPAAVPRRGQRDELYDSDDEFDDRGLWPRAQTPEGAPPAPSVPGAAPVAAVAVPPLLRRPEQVSLQRNGGAPSAADIALEGRSLTSPSGVAGRQ